MFWTKNVTPRYLTEHYSRFLDIVEKQPCNASRSGIGEKSRDLMHQYIFIMAFFTACVNNLLKTAMKPVDVAVFVAAASSEILRRLPSENLHNLEKLANSCSDCLRDGHMDFTTASQHYYDQVVMPDSLHTVPKDEYMRIVCSASAGLIAMLRRDGHALR